MLKCLWAGLLLLTFTTSCVNTRQAVYFNNVPDATSFEEIQIPESVIQKNDLLSISVSSPNPEFSKIFNLANEAEVRSTTSSGIVQQQAGYLVKQDGFINFLILGKLKAEGLTQKQLEEQIRSALIQRKLLLDPVVEIRFLNFKVTVLGEVAKPTVVTVPNEKITLLEAFGLAGDVTINARRDNVMVIREKDGKRVANRVDLTSAELFTSDFYYLKSNDIIYVEPSRARVASASRFSQLTPIILSALSLAIIVFDRVVR